MNLQNEDKDMIQEFLKQEDFGNYILSDKECVICLSSDRKTQKYKTNCGHIYCKECLFRWLENNNRCPICRSNLYDDYEMVKNFRTKLLFHMDTVLTILDALDRDQFADNHPLNGDHVLNFKLDKVLRKFQTFAIDGSVFHDFLEGFGPKSIINYLDEDYRVTNIFSTNPSAFRFITVDVHGENHIWKMNLPSFVKDDQLANTICIDGKDYYYEEIYEINMDNQIFVEEREDDILL